MGGRTNQVTQKCLGQNSKSSYQWVDGRTKSPRSVLVQNLSPTYEWKDEPSHSQVPLTKSYVFLPTGGQTNQVTYECLGKNFKSSYLWVDEQTKSPTSALIKILSPPTYGRTDELSHPQVP